MRTRLEQLLHNIDEQLDEIKSAHSGWASHHLVPCIEVVLYELKAGSSSPDTLANRLANTVRQRQKLVFLTQTVPSTRSSRGPKFAEIQESVPLNGQVVQHCEGIGRRIIETLLTNDSDGQGQPVAPPESAIEQRDEAD